MATKDSSVRRKRTHTQQDEEPASAAASLDAVSSAKKRRLNAVAISSPHAPKGIGGTIASAIGSVLGYGRRGNDKTTAVGKEQNGTSKRLYDDMPDSGDEQKTKSDQSKAMRPAVSYAKLNRKPTKSPKQSSKDLYDVPSSDDDELEFSTPMGDKSGSPLKSRQTTGSTKKSIGRTRTKHVGDDKDEARSKELHGTPSRAKRSAVKETVAQRVISTQKSPVKHIPPPTPKGILTPRHKRPGRPRKNVAFHSEDNRPTEIYFEDLPNKSKQGLPKKQADNQQLREDELSESADEEEEDEEEEEDNEVCVICSKPDSKAGNEILFCDNCDKAFHQQCYNVPVIPEEDWFCRDCLQEDAMPESSEDPTLVTTLPSAIPEIPNFEKHLQSMQRVLIDRCSGSRRLRLTGQDEAYEKTYQLVEQTVMAGEGNSMMIIGARGSGKTLLVETVISDLGLESKDTFHVVRLNGFIHTDDKLALKEIWRQLGKEMEVEDDLVNKTNNYADTLASLLALLSHPSEITGTDSGMTSKSVIFVIDEFDLFATHARQTLLYNLFDIAQARKAPIAVLGLTTRVDVVESLEKRVKSRFSHRYVHLSLPRSLPAYWDICRQGLKVDQDQLETDGFDTNLEGIGEFQTYWNEKIEALHRSQSFQDHLEYNFCTTKSVSAFLATCVLPLAALTISSSDLKIPSSSFHTAAVEPPDSKLHLLAALSDLDLSLLIAAARLDIVAHTDTVNFAMAYDEYSSQMGKQRVQSASSGMLALGAGGRVWGRAVASMAWERLVSLGLLIPAGIGGKSNMVHGGLDGKMWKLDVSLEEIPASVELPNFLVKWCTQI